MVFNVVSKINVTNSQIINMFTIYRINWYIISRRCVINKQPFILIHNISNRKTANMLTYGKRCKMTRRDRTVEPFLAGKW